MIDQPLGTVVIGGSQAGLAVGYHLKQRALPFVILDENDGYPLLEDGTVLNVSNVIWCTGFRPNLDWIDLSLPTHNGLPIHDRGIVESCPGLYFMGLLFLYSLSSALVGGVGRDAGHIVDHIVSTRRHQEAALVL
jgi:putative flavoprotein involved in K+ transport